MLTLKCGHALSVYCSQTVHHVVRKIEPLDFASLSRARSSCRSLITTDGIHVAGT